MCRFCHSDELGFAREPTALAAGEAAAQPDASAFGSPLRRSGEKVLVN
jgi:hypothetical protein